MEEAFFLDKVQKGKKIPDEATAILRKKHMIEGRKPNIYVSKQYAHSTGTQIEFSQHKGLDNKACEHLLLQALKDHGALTRQEIDRLLWNVISDQLDEKQKKNKIGNLLKRMKEDNLISNITQGNLSSWCLVQSK